MSIVLHSRPEGHVTLTKAKLDIEMRENVRKGRSGQELPPNVPKQNRDAFKGRHQ